MPANPASAVDRKPRLVSPKADPTAIDHMIRAAWAYYFDGKKQSDIAAMLGVSRASVVNYLQEAKARGYVRVTMHPEVFVEHSLSQELADAFGLTAVQVYPDGEDETASLKRVARGAADWLPRLLAPGDRLGVSWGQTVFEVSDAAADTPIDDMTVVQLVGSQATPLGFAAETCSANLARRLSAECVNLHAPLVLSDAGLAKQLSAEPSIARQLEAVRACNKTIFAAGSCSAVSHVVASGVVDEAGLQDYRARGAAAVICGRFIDASGAPIPGEIDARMIGVTLEEMRGKEMGFLVASGPERASPALAVIRGGYATHLATCTATARRLLEQAA
ncbi:putative DAK transcriptional regulator [Candidatus Rhodobacter oscarellae]|uniref:Putative DAK transcriptional regulator n=1 Tax=Candidatus Rhodobacter oscarellae TaxID=1675527 RepID=A0A0J9E9U4_9RHOB|nr:sugar-binding transcriptional regulator [Candidatus Rhodobacter lobularis]KMW59560.1 putative DAK transcriptional regulator [Candidatus Rhodobacter lobularis]